MENLKFRFINLSNDVLEPDNIESIVKQTECDYLSISKEQLEECEGIARCENLILILPLCEANELIKYESALHKFDSGEHHIIIVLYDDNKTQGSSHNFNMPFGKVIIKSEELVDFIRYLETISKEGFISFDAEDFWGQIHGKQNLFFSHGNGCDVVSALNSLLRNINDEAHEIEKIKNFVLSIHSHAEASCADFELISNMISNIVPDSSEIIWSAVLEESACGYKIGLLYG